MASGPAIVARDIAGETVCGLERIDTSELPGGPILAEVLYSSLNYKDALAVCGNRGRIMKALPFVPGIDLVARIVESDAASLPPGTTVVATGWGLGERHWGALSSFVRLQPEWVVPLPDGLSPRQAMALGTAGITAMLCVEAIEAGGAAPGSGEILITGASGGVGSIALLLLSGLGFRPVALTGRPEQEAWFRALGAQRVMARAELDRDPRPLEPETWDGAIDTVGGRILATALAQLRYGGVVSACGLAGGSSLPTTVMPFILRGARLQGIDSVYLAAQRRPELWARLAALVPEARLAPITREISLAEVPAAAAVMLAGRAQGRTVVRVSDRHGPG